jgi:hypothetical protein
MAELVVAAAAADKQFGFTALALVEGTADMSSRWW